MAVQQFFFSDRDSLEDVMANPEKLMFADKAAAQQRDRELELAENFMVWIQGNVKDPALTDDLADQISITVAENKDFLIKAFKKPDLFLQSETETDDSVVRADQ